MLTILWLVAAVLCVLWVLGMATSFTMGGLVHVLLVLAIVAVLVRVIIRRQVV